MTVAPAFVQPSPQNNARPRQTMRVPAYPSNVQSIFSGDAGVSSLGADLFNVTHWTTASVAPPVQEQFKEASNAAFRIWSQASRIAAQLGTEVNSVMIANLVAGREGGGSYPKLDEADLRNKKFHAWLLTKTMLEIGTEQQALMDKAIQRLKAASAPGAHESTRLHDAVREASGAKQEQPSARSLVNAFLAVCERWNLTAAQVATLAGSNDPGYAARMKSPLPVPLTRDQRDRFALVFGISYGLGTVFRNNRDAEIEWMRRANPELNSRSPLDTLLGGGVLDFDRVKKVVAAFRGL